MLSLGPIKARVAMMRAVPLRPDDNPTPGDNLARDVDALIAEVKRLRRELEERKEMRDGEGVNDA